MWGSSRHFASIYCHRRIPVLKWLTKILRSAQHQQKFMALQFLHQSSDQKHTTEIKPFSFDERDQLIPKKNRKSLRRTWSRKKWLISFTLVPASNSKTAWSTAEISNADIHCVKGHEVFYMVTFLYYLVSLKTGPYTWAKTRSCKTDVTTDGYFCHICIPPTTEKYKTLHWWQNTIFYPTPLPFTGRQT